MSAHTETMRREIARRVDAGTLDRRCVLYRRWLQAVRLEKAQTQRALQPAAGG